MPPRALCCVGDCVDVVRFFFFESSSLSKVLQHELVAMVLLAKSFVFFFFFECSGVHFRILQAVVQGCGEKAGVHYN